MGLSLLHKMGTETPACREGGLRKGGEVQHVVKGCALGSARGPTTHQNGACEETYEDSLEGPLSSRDHTSSPSS